MDPIIILAAVAIAVIAFGAGRWFQKQQDPLIIRGKLLDRMAADADRLKALQAGDTPERIAEKAREAAVLAGLKTGIQAVE